MSIRKSLAILTATFVAVVSCSTSAFAETDAVAEVYNWQDANISTQVLADLKLQDTEWEFCRVKSSDQGNPFPGYAHVDDNQLLVSLQAQLDAGQTTQGNLLVQVCNEQEILDWQRVAVIIKAPYESVVSGQLINGRCRISLTNMDPELVAEANLRARKGPFQYYLSAAPGETASVTLEKVAPKRVTVFRSLYGDTTYIALPSAVVNTKTCSVTYDYGK